MWLTLTARCRWRWVWTTTPATWPRWTSTFCTILTSTSASFRSRTHRTTTFRVSRYAASRLTTVVATSGSNRLTLFELSTFTLRNIVAPHPPICVSVTSRCALETDEGIKLVFFVQINNKSKYWSLSVTVWAYVDNTCDARLTILAVYHTAHSRVQHNAYEAMRRAGLSAAAADRLMSR